MEPLTTILFTIGAVYLIWRFGFLGLITVTAIAVPEISPILVILLIWAIIENRNRKGR